MKKVERMGASHRGLHPKLLYGLILILGVVCLFEAHPALAASTCEGSRAYIRIGRVPTPGKPSGANENQSHTHREESATTSASSANSAIVRYKKEAAKGSSQAQYLIGFHYLQRAQRTHNPREYRKAVYWIKRSVANGCTAAFLPLGLMTEYGLAGIPKDVHKGRQMILTAAKGGDPEAQWWLAANIYVTRPKAGFAWMKRAADAGYPPAELGLATMFLDGKTTKENPRAAIALVETVYAGKSFSAPTAAYLLGGIYMKGLGGVPVDDSRAFKWMIIAANYRVPHAAHFLKVLAGKLPKGKLRARCGVYLDPGFAADGAKPYTRIEAGQPVAVVSDTPTVYEIYYAPDRLMGFIPRGCLNR